MKKSYYVLLNVAFDKLFRMRAQIFLLTILDFSHRDKTEPLIDKKNKGSFVTIGTVEGADAIVFA